MARIRTTSSGEIFFTQEEEAAQDIIDAEISLNAQLMQMERVQEDITKDTQARLDTFARTKAYDSMLSACTYVTSSVARLKAEGQYCVTSRDSTWEVLYTILAEVEAGTRPMPESYADIEDELPTLEWPT